MFAIDNIWQQLQLAIVKWILNEKKMELTGEHYWVITLCDLILG